MSGASEPGLDKAVYPMGVVERLTGLSAQRVRYYEKVGLISPARSKGNHRLYSEREIARLKSIRELMDSRLTTGMVRLLLEKERES